MSEKARIADCRTEEQNLPIELVAIVLAVGGLFLADTEFIQY